MLITSMHKQLSALIISLVLFAACKGGKKELLTAGKKVRMQRDSNFTLDNTPSIQAKNDSACFLFSQGGNFFYEYNYLTGKAVKQYRLETLFPRDSVCAALFHMDTTTPTYKSDWALRQKFGYGVYSLMAIENLHDTATIIAFAIRMPQLRIENSDTVYSETIKHLIAIKPHYKDAFDLKVWDLEWKENELSIFSPDFGFFVYKDHLLAGAFSQAYDTGSIYKSYRLPGLVPEHRSLIRHQGFTNPRSFPLISFYHFATYNNQSFVSNVSGIYNIASNKLLYDFKKDLGDIQNIKFFYPLDTSFHKWFLNYYMIDTLKKEELAMSYFNAVVDITAGKVLEQQVAKPATFSYYKDKIIAVEKDKDDLFFVQYTL